MPEERLGPLFQPPTDPSGLPYLIAVLAGVTILLAAVALVRGRLLGPQRFTGSYATAVLMIPAFAMVLGDLFLLEESKEVEFCGSCHTTMKPVVDAMRFDGDTLAAVHYRSGAVSHAKACYQCHSGYGLYGTVGAKLDGAKHMWRAATGDYSLPLSVHGPFDLDSCLNCHAAAEPFRAVDAHRDPELQQQLLDGELGCTGLCHAEAHPKYALQGEGAP